LQLIKHQQRHARDENSTVLSLYTATQQNAKALWFSDTKRYRISVLFPQ